MPLPPILTTSEEVSQLGQQLQTESVIAVDLEADSMHNYQEKVCLLQFSTATTTVLVDPLAVDDLSALKGILAEPQTRKIFHAADYDIRCLARDFDIEINGLFDTMISSQFLGEERFGLADMLKKYFDLNLDKKYQRADWSKRPLTEGMIRYAGGDTAYLHQLSEILEQRLVEKGRREWVEEEFRLLEKVRFAAHDGPLYLRFKGAGTVTPRQLAVLEQLLQWRDQEAQRRDCPHYKVLGNKVVLELARMMPHNQRQLTEIAGISPRLNDRYGARLLAEVATGRDVAEGDLPLYPRNQRKDKDPRAEKRLTRLKDWRQKAAKALEFDPGVLINNATLEELAYKNPGDDEALQKLCLLKNWQRNELGQAILKTLSR